MFLCSLKYCLKCYFSKGVYSFTLSTVYIYIYIYIYICLPEGSRENRQVTGVLDDPPGFPYTPPGVDVLEGGKLTSNNVEGSSHDPLQSFVVASGAVSKPGGDAAGQDALSTVQE